MNEGKIFILDEKDKVVIDESIQVITEALENKAATDLSNVTENALENLGAAPAEHKHDISDFNDTIPVENGGTGAGNAEGARTNLDVYSKGEVNSIFSGTSEATHGHPIATATASGFMSYTDKAKLDTFPTQIVIHKGTNSLPNAVKGAILIAYDA